MAESEIGGFCTLCGSVPAKRRLQRAKFPPDFGYCTNPRRNTPPSAQSPTLYTTDLVLAGVCTPGPAGSAQTPSEMTPPVYKVPAAFSGHRIPPWAPERLARPPRTDTSGPQHLERLWNLSTRLRSHVGPSSRQGSVCHSPISAYVAGRRAACHSLGSVRVARPAAAHPPRGTPRRAQPTRGRGLSADRSPGVFGFFRQTSL